MFLDRDGVLIEDTGYVSRVEDVRLLPGVGVALRRLQAAGWGLVVVTNQSGVARGYLDLQRLAEIHDRLRDLLSAEDVRLNALYYCPHLPGASVPGFDRVCEHRKPAPGMLLSAARALRLDLTGSWMVGDKPSDMEAGRAAGCAAILIDDGRRSGGSASDLIGAAALIAARDC